MCRAVRCRACRKTTWAGCGRHVDQVMARVAPAERCPGHARQPGTGLLARLLKR